MFALSECARRGCLQEPFESRALQLIGMRACDHMSQAVAHRAELPNRSIQFVGFGREQLAVDTRPPVRREHRCNFIEGETRSSPQSNHCESVEYTSIEYSA